MSCSHFLMIPLEFKNFNGEVNNLKAGLSFFSDHLKKTIPGMKKLVTLLLALLTLAIFTLLNSVAEGKEAEILLLCTSNVTGHLFPCPT